MNKIKMNFRIAILLVVFSIVSVAISYAKQLEPVLVLDMRNAPQLPNHFRSTQLLHVIPQSVNRAGLESLHIAGGGQYSEMSLLKILQKLRITNMTIIDLRQESHGFMNGNAISWYGHQDAANAGKTDLEIDQDQAERLAELGKQESAFVYRIIQKSAYGDIEKAQQVEFAVHHVSTEEALVQKHHLNYHRLYVQDFHAPNEEQVERFLDVVKQIKPDEWVYFHCRAGVGRTTTFMVMYDMLHNAKNVSFDDILARQQALGGKDLTSMPSRDSFKYKYAVERLAFLKKFYDYARHHQDLSWTAYLSQKNE